MIITGDASKARLIAAFIDHLIAFALMMLVVAFVPESLPQVKALFFFSIYLGYFVVLEALWSRTLGKFRIGNGLAECDPRDCLPHRTLKRRPTRGDLDGKAHASAVKIFRKLAFRLT